MLTAIQMHSFAFILGFLPPWANQQYNEAKWHYLLNNLGSPDVSSFAAYVYFAGLHLNRDICITHGWVINRSEKVHLIYVIFVTFYPTYMSCRFKEKNSTSFIVTTN
jgi:hypothetical protein